MNAISIRGRALPAASLLIAVVAVIAIVASGALARGGDSGPGAQPSPTPSSEPSPQPTPTPLPTTEPTPDPTVEPTPEPTPVPEPSEEPSEAPSDGVFELDVNTPDNHDVMIIVEDATGNITGVTSGTPGDGMSVRWFDMKVENVDPNTLRLTWVGLPFDQDVQLFVAMRDDGKLRLRMVQPGPPAYSDAIGFDRVLNLTFDRPVSADDVLPTIQESLDTAD
jgi:hypothetical protein